MNFLTWYRKRQRSKLQLRLILETVKERASPNADECAGRFGDAAASDTGKRVIFRHFDFATPVHQELARLLVVAGVNRSVLSLLVTSAICGVVTTYLASMFLTPMVLPAVGALGLWTPIAWLHRRARDRALRFIADYPPVLLAAASSLKAGLTPFQAMQRATRLLPLASPVRQEIELLLHRIDEGVSRERAISEFGRSYREPQLELFRSAFALALEHGGRFSPTLTRLATVSHSRSALIGSANVSTANMRMTANVLLLIGPGLLILMTSRSAEYWQTLQGNPTANVVGSLGVMMIVGCYLLLRWMSAFKP